jgi:hypothetical protein
MSERGQKTEVGSWKSECGSRNTEHGAKRIADRVKTQDARGLKTEDRILNAEVGIERRG